MLPHGSFWTENRGFLIRRLICKIVSGGVGVELGYALHEFSSERALEVVVVGRDACADCCSPMIAAIRCFHEGSGKISVLPVRDHRSADRFGLKPILEAFRSPFVAAGSYDEFVGGVSFRGWDEDLAPGTLPQPPRRGLGNHRTHDSPRH